VPAISAAGVSRPGVPVTDMGHPAPSVDRSNPAPPAGLSAAGPDRERPVRAAGTVHSSWLAGSPRVAPGRRPRGAVLPTRADRDDRWRPSRL